MHKTFVLDTNVLLHDPGAMFGFEDNDVVIPIYVVEEIDNFKKDLSELGRNARQVSRYLDQLREEGSLCTGIKLDKGGILRVVTTSQRLPSEVTMDRGQDAKILAVAFDLKNRLAEKSERVVLITKDTNLRIRADAIGIDVENFDPEPTTVNQLFTGYSEVEVPGELVDQFYREGAITLPDPYYAPNEFIILKDRDNASHSGLGRFDHDSA